MTCRRREEQGRGAHGRRARIHSSGGGHGPSMNRMNWDDLRFVLALARAGSLARAAKELGVDHTTVGRRIEAAERSLGLRLFSRTSTGYLPTADAERLLGDLRGIEDAVGALERNAHASRSAIDGLVRVTAPETFGCCYLAPCLAALHAAHPNLTLELRSTGAVLDLARREADLAVRMFRARHENLVVRRIGTMRYGLYASRSYLDGRPLREAGDLRGHALLASEAPDDARPTTAPDAQWLEALSDGARPTLVCELSMALMEACRAGMGVAVLPRFLGDREEALVHVPMPDPPSEAIWITVHRDLRDTPRVRAVLDHIAAAVARDATSLMGA